MQTLSGPPPVPPPLASAPSSWTQLFGPGIYRWLFGSNLAFFLGMGGQQVVRGFLAFQLTGKAFALGGVSFAAALPMLLLSPIGGVLADRMDRRRLIMSAQILVLLSETSILLLYVLGWLQFWHLVASGLVMGCVFPLLAPARVAVVATSVPRSLLPRAIATNMTGMNATRVIGPAMGGLLIFGDDVRIAYAVGLGFYGLAYALMWAVPPSPAPLGARERSVAANLGEGFRYVIDHRIVLLLLAFGLVPMFLGLPFQQLLPVFTEKVWPVGPRGLGMLAGATGLGGVAGSIFVVWRGDRAGRVELQLLAMIGFGAGIALFCFTPWFFLALPLAALATFCASVFGTLNSTAIQVLVPDAVRGRVSSFLMTAFSLPLLGVLPLSYLADVIGPRYAVSLAGVLAVSVALAFYVLSSTLRAMDQEILRAEERDADGAAVESA